VFLIVRVACCCMSYACMVHVVCSRTGTGRYWSAAADVCRLRSVGCWQGDPRIQDLPVNPRCAVGSGAAREGPAIGASKAGRSKARESKRAAPRARPGGSSVQSIRPRPSLPSRPQRARCGCTCRAAHRAWFCEGPSQSASPSETAVVVQRSLKERGRVVQSQRVRLRVGFACTGRRRDHEQRR
jgi:hypothetical protein